MSAPETAHPGGLGLPDENRGPDILIGTTIVTAFALITVVARLYVRIALIRNVGLDVSRSVQFNRYCLQVLQLTLKK